MSVGTKRAAIGITVTIVLIVLIPVAYWFLSSWLDDRLSLRLPIFYAAAVFLGAACIVIGLFWITWAYSYLHFVGKGIPLELFGYALHPTRILVTTGPYAYTRNPMLLGELFLLLAIALLQPSMSGLLLIPVIGLVLLGYLKLFEEPTLRKRFNGDYEGYRRNVPLLFPRLNPYVHEPVAG